MPKNILEYSADDIIRLVRRDAEEHLIKGRHWSTRIGAVSLGDVHAF